MVITAWLISHGDHLVPSSCKIELIALFHIEELDIPNAVLARETGLSHTTIGAAVRGESIRLSSAEAICEALHYKVEDLFVISEKKQPLSPKTVLEHHRLISTILHQTEKEMLIQYNAASRATPPKIPRRSAKFYQPAEMDLILDTLELAPLKWKTITYLMIDTGCRRGEIMGLRWDSVNLDTGRIMIENNLLYSKEKGIYNGPTKTDRVRALIVAPQCLELIKRWKK